MNSQREMDVIDILHGSAARDAESHDSNFASYFWNISQNASKEKHKTATPGIASCISPGGDFFVPSQGRCLLGCEKLLFQGIPYFRLGKYISVVQESCSDFSYSNELFCLLFCFWRPPALGNETEVQLGDLAGNAMSLTVVSATMLAAIVAPQLREEVEANNMGIMRYFSPTKRKADGTHSTDVDPKKIMKHLEKHTGFKDEIIDKAHNRWDGEISTSNIDIESVIAARSHVDDSALSFLTKLADLVPLAVNNSIWCTCETSGTNSSTNKFIQCKYCCVSCCRNCIHATSGYNLTSHETQEVTAANERNIGMFQTELRNILPPFIYFPEDSIEKIAAIENDSYRIRGLHKFTFGLHRIKRDRGKWFAIYYARDNHGTGEAIAELRITIGQVRRAQTFEPKTLGVKAELTSFMPARVEPLQYGKLEPCCKIIIPYGNSEESSNLLWQIRMPEERTALEVVGEGKTDSYRMEVGLTDKAAESLQAHANKKCNAKNVNAAKSRGEKSRWVYPTNWKDWPETITVSSKDKSLDGRILGAYSRKNCQQTTNQSALWVKDNGKNEEATYILLKPNVSRTGPDSAVISLSIDHNESSFFLCSIDRNWQPCDALLTKLQNREAKTYHWKTQNDFKCMISGSSIQVTSPDNEENCLVLFSGLRESEMFMLSGGNEASLIKLNVYSGQQAQQIVRVINSTVIAPLLKHCAGGGLKHDIGPNAPWESLLPKGRDPAFGECEKTIPPRPTEVWKFDKERSSWVRSSEPNAARQFYLKLQESPKPFEFWLDRRSETLKIKCYPSDRWSPRCRAAFKRKRFRR